MKPRVHDAARLDVAAFAFDAARLEGEWPGSRFDRLARSQTLPHDLAPARVTWQARGEARPVPGGEPQLWLHLRATTSVWLACRRCLQPVEQRVEVDRRIRFVKDEARAEALDAQIDEDVLALARHLDLADLIEDEMLLSLPLAPRHATCPDAGSVDGEPAPTADRPATHRPFEVLAGLGGGPGRTRHRS